MSGANPMDIKRGIDRAVERSSRTEDPGPAGHRQDDQVGVRPTATRDRRISPTRWRIGKDGVITVEEAKTSKPRSRSSRACSSIEYLSPYFVTDAERMKWSENGH